MNTAQRFRLSIFVPKSTQSPGSITSNTMSRATQLSQARASVDSKQCMSIYEKWASTYNDDLAESTGNYVAPVLAAQAALRFGSDNPAKAVILDAGCGTGLVGQALSRGGATIIDGVDLSPHMLKVAEKTGAYQNLTVGDLTQPIDALEDFYDIVMCVGTFTHGHVGPDPALREFVRVAKRGGLIVATIIDELWVSGGFKAEVEKLEAEDLIRVVSMELEDYVKGRGDKATLVILEKNSTA
ncbi:S-adenosyl-L-methionine-dependent methyltransferase [Dothidotthia symphoricarpi CBS 119687]|uniref:S-adenosyl-L-methionine-dependent methyltransferase n=1 Tax=Dothidotthia symphoricarpi CBS 119687 TaxID=1392245 RepID=A0A6A6AHX7_9PLEO|nr:S-adenosyl-L-methionine-dependent methyltransferase [Dothidotthia symphoricarpi CBS 119687]KAF2130698.1 S-adenosyl-L-methionine-dependent methyltransferase [Dothidotthia symphoricarpi CBS 119687]